MMKFTKTLLVVLLVAATVFSGCSSGVSQSSTESQASTGSTEATETSEIPFTEGAVPVNPPNEFPIVDETVELVISVVQPTDEAVDYNTNEFTKTIEEKTNLKLTWDYINGAAFTENVNMMFASGELSDVLISGVGQANRLDKSRESQLALQGMLLPLDDYIAEYAPNIQNAFDSQEGLNKYLQQADGKIYSIPTIEDGYHALWPAKMWINNTWLENLGMEQPTNIDEFYDMLVAFRDKDPNQNGLNDEIPFSTVKDGAFVMLDGYLMNPFTYSPGPDRLYLKNDEVVFSVTQDGFADGLRYLNKLYSEGLIYADSFSHDQKAQVALNENGEDPILGSFPALHFGYGVTHNTSDKWRQYRSLPPLTGPNAESPIATYTPYNKYVYGHLAITKDCENPAAAIRLVDYMYTEEGTHGARVGREGMEWERAEEGEVALDGSPAQWKRIGYDSEDPAHKNVFWDQMFPTYRDTDFYVSEAYPADPYAEGVNPNIARMVVFTRATEEHEKVSQTMENVLPSATFDTSVAAEAVQLKTTIDQYVNEMVAAFVTGNVSVDDDFEAFLQELDKMGLSRYLEIVQQSYETFYK